MAAQRLASARGALRRAFTCGALACVLGTLACSGKTVVNLLPPPAQSGGAGGDGNMPDASAPRLIHRYSFTGNGAQAVDSIGGADGMILGGALLDGMGHLPLDGVDDYVSLPGYMISVLTSATIVTWVDWAGGPCWQRVWDFGNTGAGANVQGTLVTRELFCSTLRCPPLGPTVNYSTPEYSDAVDGSSLFPDPGQYVPVTVVLDGVNAQMSFFVNGSLVGSNILRPLANVQDETAWLGRSLWVQDLSFAGSYDELRIYNYPLSDAERIAVEAAGPDVLP